MRLTYALDSSQRNLHKIMAFVSSSSKTMHRFGAAGIHFLICATVGLALWFLLRTIWYPSPLFRAVGGETIFLMLLGIDIVLGPLLTLVVWKDNDPRTRRDLIVVACLQVAAVVYGLNTLWEGRPVYIVALGRHYELLQASDIHDKDLEEAGQHLPRFGPKWVGVKDATDLKEKEKIAFAGLADRDYGHFPKYHAPIESMAEEIVKKGKKISELKRFNPDGASQIDSWLKERGQSDESVIYQGLRTRAQEMAVVMDAKTAKVIGVAPFKPWP
jgi:hypothetical protein